jgi:coatomer protein complex subunit alpha (xenin)
MNSADPSSLKRILELSVYFTHCGLQPAHLVLSLRSAMANTFKNKCYRTTASLIRRLLELGPSAQFIEQARKLQTVVESQPVEEIILDYDPLNPFVICAGSKTPIYRGSNLISCAFCKSTYKPEYQGKVCSVCEISSVGGVGTGLRLLEMPDRQ